VNKKLNKVWVVMKGDNYEGGSVVAVTKYRTLARSMVRKVKNDIDFNSEFQWASFFRFKVMEVVE